MRAWLAWACVLGLTLACTPSTPPSTPPPVDAGVPDTDAGDPYLSSLPRCTEAEERSVTVTREYYIQTHTPLYRVWGASPSDVWAVRESTYLERGLHRWDGTRWTRHLEAEQFAPRALGGSSASDVWFGGAGGKLFHWSGTTLSPVDSGTSYDIYEIQVVDAQNAWALAIRATGKGYHLLHWNGAAWRVEAELTAFSERLHVTAADEVWLIGYQHVLRWRRGTLEPMFQDGTSPTAFLWASGPEDVWVVKGAVLQRWNGSTLSPVPGAPANVKQLWGTGPQDVWFAAAESTQLFHWDGTRVQAFDPPGGFSDWQQLLGTRPDDVWAVNGPWLLHWDGQAWTLQEKLAEPVHDSSRYFLLWPVGPDALWSYESPYRQVQLWDGQRRTPVPGTGGERTPPRDLHDVWAVSPTDVWVVGARGTAAHFDGTQWTLTPTGTEVDLHGVSATGPTDAWAVGDLGTVLHWDGLTWSRVETRTSVPLLDVWSGAGERAVVVGDNAVALRWRAGGGWQALPGAEWTLSAVWGAGPEDLWGLSNGGTLVHWLNGTLEELDVPGQHLVPSKKVLWGLHSPRGLIAPGRWRSEDGLWHPVSVPLDSLRHWRGAWQGPTGEVWLALSTFGRLTGQEYVASTTGRCWRIRLLLANGAQLPEHSLLALQGAGEHDVWSVGTGGHIFHLRY